MRLSNTAIKELKKRYKNILIKCAMLNAAALLAFATPAMAEISAPLDYDGTSGTINEDIKISTTNDDGIFVATPNGTTNVGTLSINADSVSVITTANGNYAAIWSANRTYDPATENRATVDIKANNIYISAPVKALTAMSQGVINLSGNTIIEAPNAILARGDAIVNINTDNTDKTLQMTGNIEFAYDKTTSGTPIDATVTVNLNGANSYWNGNILKNWSTNIDDAQKEDLLKVEQGLSLTLNDGASWTATAINSTIPPEQVAVTSLTVNKGTIHSEKGNAHVKNAIINGDLTLNGTLTTVSGGTITFENGSTLTTTFDSSTVKFDGDGAVAGTINLTSLSAGTYTFMGENVDHSALSFADNTLYDITLDGDNLVVTTKAVDSIAEKTGASQQETSALVAMVAADGSGTEKGQLIADALSEAMQSGNTDIAIDATKQAAPTTAQVTQGIAKEAAGTVARLASGRMAAVKGRSGGDITEGAGLWVQALYNHTKQNATSSSDGFKADSEGIALGVDKEVSENVTLGIGYGYMKTDVDSYGREMDVDGHNFFVYGKYQPSQWYVSSVLSYNYSKYTEKKAPMGVNLRSEYDVNSYSAQMMTGYEYQNGWTPEAGLRYLVVDADSYFDGMQRVSSDKDDVLTAVVGLKYETTRKANCLSFKPYARVALTYDVLSDNATANVFVSGGGNYRTESQRLHRLGAEADLGVTATVKNVDVTLEYNGAFRQDYTSQGGMLKLRYHF